MEKDEFIAKALRALQTQISELMDLAVQLENRINRLEMQNMWNVMQGKIEQTPHTDDFVMRLANGNIVNNQPEDEEDDGSGSYL